MRNSGKASGRSIKSQIQLKTTVLAKYNLKCNWQTNFIYLTKTKLHYFQKAAWHEVCNVTYCFQTKNDRHAKQVMLSTFWKLLIHSYWSQLDDVPCMAHMRIIINRWPTAIPQHLITILWNKWFLKYQNIWPHAAIGASVHQSMILNTHHKCAFVTLKALDNSQWTSCHPM